jgi:hypothetical protein
MSEPPAEADPRQEPGDARPTFGEPSWITRRRDRIVAEIQRNRRGEYRVPTWVLAATLAAILCGYALLLILG